MPVEFGTPTCPVCRVIVTAVPGELLYAITPFIPCENSSSGKIHLLFPIIFQNGFHGPRSGLFDGILSTLFPPIFRLPEALSIEELTDTDAEISPTTSRLLVGVLVPIPTLPAK